jgi:hypothetical protein
MKRVMAIGFAGVLLATSMVSATDKAPAAIGKGALVGVVNLLDAEVTHYHAAKDTNANFLKIHPVSWSVDDMLSYAVKDELGKKGLAPVPLVLTDSLARAREQCFVSMPLARGLPKGWPKECSVPLVELANSAGVNTLILLSPGVNNSGHAGSSNHDGLSETLRGWGFFTRERASSQEKPTLFDETELLLIGITPQGATLLARKWGGTLTIQWQSYTRPADPKELTPAQLDELQPLFAAVLARQASELLEQVRVEQ